MLNLFKLNLKKKSSGKITKNRNIIKYYPSFIREWNNSIYSFNKNIINLIPHSSLLAIKLIKSYFNLYNNQLDIKTRENKLLKRLRRLSSNKIFLSSGEFKHRNDKVTIILYIYNRQMYNYKLNIEKHYFKSLETNLISRNKIFELINKRSLKFLKEISKNNINDIKKNLIKYKYISDYINNYLIKFVRKSLKELSIYIYYKQLIYLNQSKFSYTYLQYLRKFLMKVYNKNVEFNLINLKRFYLNSDILSESITLKIKKNRRKLLKYLNTLKRKIKINLKNNFFYDIGLKKSRFYIDDKNLERIILKNIKYKDITGFRLETKGRLTRRYTASRSISKLIYKGNLSNIDSSYRGYSSILIRGNNKSNLQYTKLKSKTRIGSFGIKGWISGN